MCGIFAYLNAGVPMSRKAVLAMLVNGLKRLEYRGYDSSGVAVDGRIDPAGRTATDVFRATGNVSRLEAKIARKEESQEDVTYESQCGIAHTRWATHGKPSVRNSHPHASDEHRAFVVVHNGIITNYQPLKEKLQAAGYQFVTDTDTEVIAVLCLFFYDRALAELRGESVDLDSFKAPATSAPREAPPVTVTLRGVARRVVSELEGAYALIIKSEHFPNELVAVAKGSPLIMGIRSPDVTSDTVKLQPHGGELGGPAGSGSAGAAGPSDSPAGVPRSREIIDADAAPDAYVSPRASRRSGLLEGSSRASSGGISPLGSSSDLKGGANPALKAAKSALKEAGKSQDDTLCAEYFLASDTAALLEHTRRVIFFEDDDMVHIAHGAFRFFSREALSTATKPILSLDASVDALSKGGFPHFMLKEIHDQPEAIAATIRGRVRWPSKDGAAPDPTADRKSLRASRSIDATKLAKGDAAGAAAAAAAAAADAAVEDDEDDKRPMRNSSSSSDDEDDVETMQTFLTGYKVNLGGLRQHIESIRRCRRLIFIACGTSYHSARATQQLVEELTRLPVAVEIASEFLDRETPVFRDDTCFFISQSGETADTLSALRYCREQGALCVGICNTPGSAIARLTQCGVYLRAGAEIGVASTKAYTSQVTALVMIALQLGEDSIEQLERRREIIRGLRDLPAQIQAMLYQDPRIQEIATGMKDAKNLLIIGRGYGLATALEASLKIKELAYIHCEGISAGELKHGTLALVDDEIHLIVFAPQDSLGTKVQNALEQIVARGGKPLVVYTEGDDATKAKADEWGCESLGLPPVVDCLAPILNIVPMQLLAYHLALLNGRDVDQPRNLAKSVTVE